MQGKAAIVTAGVGGMGRAMCRRFARYGVKRAVTELKAAAAQRITEALRAVDAPGMLFDPDAA